MHKSAWLKVFSLLELYAPVGTYLAVKSKLNAALLPAEEISYTCENQYSAYSCDNYTCNLAYNEQTYYPQDSCKNQDYRQCRSNKAPVSNLYVVLYLLDVK